MPPLRFGRRAALLAAATSLATPALAQRGWPAGRPIEIVVPFAVRLRRRTSFARAGLLWLMNLRRRLWSRSGRTRFESRETIARIIGFPALRKNLRLFDPLLAVDAARDL